MISLFLGLMMFKFTGVKKSHQNISCACSIMQNCLIILVGATNHRPRAVLLNMHTSTGNTSTKSCTLLITANQYPSI